MGRRKKRVTDEQSDNNENINNNTLGILIQTPDQENDEDIDNSTSIEIKKEILLGQDDDDDEPSPIKTKEDVITASKYSVLSGTGEIVPDDVYVSESEEDAMNEANDKKDIEIILTNSIMGLMRSGRGGVLGVNNYMRNTTWVRKTKDDNNEEDKESEEQEEIVKEETIIENDDPIKKLEQLKINARRLESAENAGRDPCLFSKRTAFDIRMDQIEDKPWVRGTGDVTDYFNYGLTEEDWLEYAEQQLTVRNELTDAARQKRLPDPTIVPVLPKTPSKQNPKVAVASLEELGGSDSISLEPEKASNMLVGPTPPTNDTTPTDVDKKEEAKTEPSLLNIAGAWGAGVATDSVLAKLINDQFMPRPPPMIIPTMPPPPPPPKQIPIPPPPPPKKPKPNPQPDQLQPVQRENDNPPPPYSQHHPPQQQRPPFHGGPHNRPGYHQRPGPGSHYPPPHMMRGGPGQHPPIDQRPGPYGRGPPGPPIDRGGPPGPPMDRGGPPGPPMDQRPGPPGYHGYPPHPMQGGRRTDQRGYARMPPNYRGPPPPNMDRKRGRE